MSSTKSSASRRAAALRNPALLATVAALCGCATVDRDFRQAARRRPDQAAYLARFRALQTRTDRRQYAALSDTLSYWRRSIPAAELRAECGALPPLPTAAFLDRIVRIALRERLWVHPDAATPELLTRYVRVAVPPLVFLRFENRPETELCAIVGVDHGSLGWLAMTDRGPLRLEAGEFEAALRRGGNAALAMCPPGFPRWDLSASERIGRAAAYMDFGLPHAALADYARSIEDGLSTAETFTGMGNAYYKLARNAEAVGAYRRAVALDNMDARALNNLAYALVEAGEASGEAVELARRATILDPGNPLYLDTLGVALHAAGDTVEAARVLERARGRARAYSPAIQSRIAVHLALVYFADGLDHLVREVAADALRLDPKAVLPDAIRPTAQPATAP